MERPDDTTEKDTPDRPRGSWLAGALSIEYSPCSIPASELASAAHDIKPPQGFDDITVFIEDKEPEKILPLIHDPTQDGYAHRIVALPLTVPSTQLCSTLQIRDSEYTGTGHSSSGYVQTPLPFSLVQNISETKRQRTKEVVVKRKVRRNKKVPTEVVEYGYIPGDIWLADRIAGGKVLLPIATFEKRIDGTCSYVQLGQEITDDSVFALQSDEKTRLKLIEDLRKLVTPTQAKSELTDTVRDFVKQERERNAEYLIVALGAWISEHLSKRLTNTGKIHHNVVIEGDEKIEYQDKVKKTILESHNEKNKVNIGVLPIVLEVSQPVEEEEENIPITISAVARGNVAFPIAQFFPKTRETQLIGADHLSAVDKYKNMLAIVAILDEENEKEFAEAVDDAEITPRHFLMTTLGLDQQIKDRLSPHDEAQEDLAWAVGTKALGIRYHGTVDNVNLNVTNGSVVGYVELRHVNELYEAHIFAKPAKLHGMPINEIDTFVFDPTLPLTEEFPKGEDAKEFTMLIKGFNQADKPG